MSVYLMERYTFLNILQTKKVIQFIFFLTFFSFLLIVSIKNFWSDTPILIVPFYWIEFLFVMTLYKLYGDIFFSCHMSLFWTFKALTFGKIGKLPTLNTLLGYTLFLYILSIVILSCMLFSDIKKIIYDSQL